jgi:uncharacterized protein YabN with tetrapyrrole methylase and pyrophosphatase domain
METETRNEGKKLVDMTLDEMDQYWNKAKKLK